MFHGGWEYAFLSPISSYKKGEKYMMITRVTIAGLLFFTVTIGNLIQKFYPNDITVWFQNPMVTMSFYSVALVIFALPFTKGKLGVLVISICIIAAAFLTYAFSTLYGVGV